MAATSHPTASWRVPKLPLICAWLIFEITAQEPGAADAFEQMTDYSNYEKRTWSLYKLSFEIRTPNPNIKWVKYEGTLKSSWARFRFFISPRYLSMKWLVKLVSDVRCTNTINYCSNHIWCAFPCRPQKAHVSLSIFTERQMCNK